MALYTPHFHAYSLPHPVFPHPSFFPPLSFPSPLQYHLLLDESTPFNQLGNVGERCQLPSGIWGPPPSAVVYFGREKLIWQQLLHGFLYTEKSTLAFFTKFTLIILLWCCLLWLDLCMYYLFATSPDLYAVEKQQTNWRVEESKYASTDLRDHGRSLLRGLENEVSQRGLGAETQWNRGTNSGGSVV